MNLVRGSLQTAVSRTLVNLISSCSALNFRFDWGTVTIGERSDPEQRTLVIMH